VCKFDYTLGYKFSTYASWWVRRFQQIAVVAASPATVSAADEARILEMISAEQSLCNELRRTPTDGEIADRLGSTAKAVQQVRAMLRGAVSLDQPAFGGDSPAYSDLMCAAEAESDDVADVDLEELLAVLPARERAVVGEAFGLAGRPARSVTDLAQAHRLPPSAVEAVLDRALSLMRGAASAPPGQAA